MGWWSVASGLAIPPLGQTWELDVGPGFFIAFLGNSGLTAPLYVYVSRWFDRHRGSALALIASGQYVSGAIWPPIFDYAVGEYGWRQTMLMFAVFEVAVIVPIAIIFLKRPPEILAPATASEQAARPTVL